MCGEMAVSSCLKCCEVQTVSKLAVPDVAAGTVAFSVANVDFLSPNLMILVPPLEMENNLVLSTSITESPFFM